MLTINYFIVMLNKTENKQYVCDVIVHLLHIIQIKLEKYNNWIFFKKINKLYKINTNFQVNICLEVTYCGEIIFKTMSKNPLLIIF